MSVSTKIKNEQDERKHQIRTAKFQGLGAGLLGVLVAIIAAATAIFTNLHSKNSVIVIQPSLTSPISPPLPVAQVGPYLHTSPPVQSLPPAPTQQPNTNSGTGGESADIVPQPVPPPKPDQWLQVPDVKGKTLEEANDILMKSGYLHIEVVQDGTGIRYNSDEALAKYSLTIVDTTNPARYSKLQAGQLVTIFIVAPPVDPNNPAPK